MSEQRNTTLRISLWTAVAFILAAAMSRILPHPHNFTPVVGMTLFGAAIFKDKRIALAIPLLAMLLSDLILNNLVYGMASGEFIWLTPGAGWIYGSILLIGALGFLLFRGKRSLGRIVGGSLSGSVLFFLITNFGVWMHGGLYPKTWSGLMSCYAAGIPFFQNAVAGDLFYCGLLFGGFYLIKTYALQDSSSEIRSW